MPTTPARILAASLVAVVVLAGCSGTESGTRGVADTGHIDQTVLPTGETAGGTQATDGGKAEAAAGNGEIRGTVQDDAGLPVANALVSRIGSEASTTTGRDGGFRFTNVSSGTHVLRVTASDVYRVHEGEVTVVADRVTLVTVTLVPLDGRGPGYRPHLHDHWGDKAELSLFDMDLDYGKAGFAQYGAVGDALSRTYSANQGTFLFFSIPDRDDGQPPIVLPGTKEIRFTVSWDPADVDVDRFEVGHHSGDVKWGSELGENGVPFVIAVDEDDADNGHQVFSLWQFRIRPQARTVPMTILGPIHVQATLVKGELPVDPPHEDFWAGNATYLARSWDSTIPGISNCCTDAHVTVKPDAKRLIPPGTSSLSIRMGYAFTQAPGTAADLEWELLAKPANLPPGVGLDQYRVLQPASEATSLKVYDVPVDGSETDAFYQVNSNWIFVIRQEGTDLLYGLAEAQHQFRLEIVANKDPAYV
jgi:hypothetical protein